eukprot:2488352-Rhodomonas_salina.1
MTVAVPFHDTQNPTITWKNHKPTRPLLKLRCESRCALQPAAHQYHYLVYPLPLHVANFSPTMFKPVLVLATVCASASAFAPAAVPGLMGRAAARPTAVR